MTVRERVDRIQKEIFGVAAQYGVDQWQLLFLADIKLRSILSPKQERALQEIERRVFPNEFGPDAA